ncbi:hypothetical protein AAW02_22450 [Aeromonas dhakensis]|nr:hypothetical protein AAW02_22450 [Aeromonas dhakensis]PHS83752.1 hypothetical protein AAW03_19135 [Aeromonas dhakensis]
MKKCLWFLIANYLLVLFDMLIYHSDEYSVLTLYYIVYPFILMFGVVCEVVFIFKRQWGYAAVNGVLGVTTVVIADYLGR